MSDTKDEGQASLFDDAAAKAAADEQADKTPEPIPHTQEAADQEAAAKAEADKKPGERPENIPEKFWDAKTGTPRVDAMAKSYAELESKFRAGKHKAPEKYDLKPLEKAGIQIDDELLSEYQTWAKNSGISQDAFEQLSFKVAELVGAKQQKLSVDIAAEKAKLGPKADELLQSNWTWAQSMVRKGVWSGEHLEEFKIMAGTALGLDAIMRLRNYFGDQPIPTGVVAQEGAETHDDLMALIAKPEYKTDPALRAKAEKLAARLSR